jgi:hypothetical protein
MIKKIFLFLILSINFSFGQTNTKIRGIITDNKTTIEQAVVTNKNTQHNSITNSLGKFAIEANFTDTLEIKHKDYYLKKIVLTPELIQNELVLIELKPLSTDLDEIVITTSGINQLSLGIIQNPIKDYTKSERMLKTAGDFKPVHLLGILGGNLPVDPIINAITGRTKMLKKVLEKEGENELFDRLKETYDTYCLEELKIYDLEQRNMFLMYVSGIENVEFFVFTKNKETNLFNINKIYKNDFLTWSNQKN